MTPRFLAFWIFSLALLAPSLGRAENVPVQRIDSKGAMIGKTSVPKEQLATYTQEKKAQGITVKPIAEMPPQPNTPAAGGAAMPPQPNLQSQTGAVGMPPQPNRPGGSVAMPPQPNQPPVQVGH